MHTHRVKVLDGADHHTVVGPVAHDLQLELLPADDGLLDEDLTDRAGVQTGARGPLEFVGGGGDAGAPAPQDVGGPDDHRKAHGLQHFAGLAHRCGDA